jgi:hypothetical protein
LGFAWSLRIEADGRFSYSWSGCVGTYDENEGIVRSESERLLFSAVRPVSSDTPFPFPAEWLPVRWGERLYLVPANGVVGFVNQINLGREPRRGEAGFSVLRKDDWEKPAPGLPSLPPAFLKLLLAQPVTGKVISATSKQAQLTLGARHGVFPGMELATQSTSGDGCVLTVTQVWPGQSVAEAWCIIGRVPRGATVSSRDE